METSESNAHVIPHNRYESEWDPPSDGPGGSPIPSSHTSPNAFSQTMRRARREQTAPRVLGHRRSIPRVPSQKSTSRGRTRSSEQSIEGEEVDPEKVTPEQWVQNTMRKTLGILRPGDTPKDLAWNLKAIMDATRTPEAIKADDEELRADRLREKKRSQSHSRSRNAKLHEKPVPDPNSEAFTERPLKRLKMSSQVKAPGHPAPSLPDLNPQPVQFDFPQHQIEEMPDEWFVEAFRLLFRRIEKFFDEYFCTQDLEGEYHQPWALKHTPEFLNYVLQVADQERGQGGWDALLRDTKQRKWLLMGILMKILMVKVFDEDLWGANKEEKELMFAIEKATFTQEGPSSLIQPVSTYTNM